MIEVLIKALQNLTYRDGYLAAAVGYPGAQEGIGHRRSSWTITSPSSSSVRVDVEEFTSIGQLAIESRRQVTLSAALKRWGASGWCRSSESTSHRLVRGRQSETSATRSSSTLPVEGGAGAAGAAHWTGIGGLIAAMIRMFESSPRIPAELNRSA